MTIARFAGNALRTAGMALRHPEFVGKAKAKGAITLTLANGVKLIGDYVGDLIDHGERVGKVYRANNGSHWVVGPGGDAHRI